jgi:hypothetical protein
VLVGHWNIPWNHHPPHHLRGNDAEATTTYRRLHVISGVISAASEVVELDKQLERLRRW